MFGLLALTGNSALSLAVPVLFALVFAPTNLWQKLLFSMCILMMSVLIATPWLVRNMQVLGSPVLNTNGGFNLYLGNNPAANGMYVSIGDTPRGNTWGELRKKGEVLASETLKAEAITWIKENPSTFITLALKKAVIFWTPPLHKGKYQASKIEPIIRTVWLIQYTVLLAAALGGLAASSLRSRTITLFWLAIVSYTAIHMLILVVFRYREPIMPLISVLAAFSFEWLFIRFRASFFLDSQLLRRISSAGPNP
jgi:hypothetical protein